MGGGVFPIYYNITMGGGALGTPNLYYVIYGRPLSKVYFRLGDGSLSLFQSPNLAETIVCGGREPIVYGLLERGS